jgi:hypothetical protein
MWYLVKVWDNFIILTRYKPEDSVKVEDKKSREFL